VRCGGRAGGVEVLASVRRRGRRRLVPAPPSIAQTSPHQHPNTLARSPQPAARTLLLCDGRLEVTLPGVWRGPRRNCSTPANPVQNCASHTR
jgi:hypothetical protein